MVIGHPSKIERTFYGTFRQACTRWLRSHVRTFVEAKRSDSHVRDSLLTYRRLAAPGRSPLERSIREALINPRRGRGTIALRFLRSVRLWAWPSTGRQATAIERFAVLSHAADALTPWLINRRLATYRLASAACAFARERFLAMPR